MDPAIYLFIFVILLAVLTSVLRLPSIKGALGERRVSRALRRHLDYTEDYRILDDITLPARSGTTQIDHIVLSPNGVFVIETKNMSGWIFGGADQRSWTQVIHRKKTRFQNPLRQNYGHVRAVQDVLGLTESQVWNDVVFAGDATPKTTMPKTVVWSARALVRFIMANRTNLFSSGEVKEMAARLEAVRLEGTAATRQAHVAQVRADIAARGPMGTGCPTCGGAMVKRRARKTGDAFLGCARFPACRGKRPMPVASTEAKPRGAG